MSDWLERSQEWANSEGLEMVGFWPRHTVDLDELGPGFGVAAMAPDGWVIFRKPSPDASVSRGFGGTKD
jgi:hypothetical protein